jgi:hypothetical protein
VAIFARPTQAWSGLEHRGQWWFPLLLTVLVALVGSGLTYRRAVVPMVIAQMESKVESGELPAEMLDRVEQQVASPLAMGMQLGSIVLVLPLVTLVFALVPWIAAGFMLGRRFRFRDAFVVTCWAGLVTLPNQILTYVLAWTNETMSNLHTGFGVLLPLEDPPTKLMLGLGNFLDHGVGPFSIWYVVVMALGAAALTGAPRKSVLVPLGGLWLVAVALFSVVAAIFGPGV